MRKFLQGVWVRTKPIVIALLGIIIGISWTYFYIEFTALKIEANWTVQEVEKLKIERLNSVGEPVGEYDGTSSTESTAQPVGEEGEDKISSLPIGEIPKIIYEVAKEKQFNDPGVLVRIAKAESSFNPCTKNPNSSAIGIFQFLDGSWEYYNKKFFGHSDFERCDPKHQTELAIAVINDHGTSDWNSSRGKWE